MIEKKITLIIGNDVRKENPELFEDFKSHDYADFYIDEFGIKKNMNDWSGDNFFGNYLELFHFFGIDKEEGFSKCKGLKIWFKEYAEFNEIDKQFWMQIAFNSGYPEQIRFNTSFGEIKDFEYDELKDF